MKEEELEGKHVFWHRSGRASIRSSAKPVKGWEYVGKLEALLQEKEREAVEGFAEWLEFKHIDATTSLGELIEDYLEYLAEKE